MKILTAEQSTEAFRHLEANLERRNRELRRMGFDRIADLYHATRSGYPLELVERMVQTAGLSGESEVLEIGCGTGQLTRQLVDHKLSVTAIDPAPSMVRIAKRQLSREVRFQIAIFEEFEAPDAVFHLVVSATAFHWVDPDIGWKKSARLLHEGGRLALLGTREDYDEPVASNLRDLYVGNTDGPATWADPPSDEDQARKAKSPDIFERWTGKPSRFPGLFGPAEAWEHSDRRSISADDLVNLEMTRATTLAYEASKREAFVRDLRKILSGLPAIELTQRSRLVMAPVASHE